MMGNILSEVYWNMIKNNDEKQRKKVQKYGQINKIIDNNLIRDSNLIYDKVGGSIKYILD